MARWTPAAVQQAAAEWVWVPPDAEQVVTEEYQLIAYPQYFQHPTKVAWSATERPVEDLIGEVAAHVRNWRRDSFCWGTRPALRGRGPYRVLLAARLALAREHGATLALVKGRVQTSGPILRRAGFTGYSEERSYRLSV